MAEPVRPQTRLDLTRVLVGQQRHITLPPGVADPTFTVQRERDAMVAELRAYVLASHLAEDVYTDSRRVPETWQDARRRARWEVVQRRSGTWQGRLLRLWWRRDLRKETKTVEVGFRVRVDRYLAYPEAQLPSPDFGAGRPMEIVTPERWGNPWP